MTTDELKIELGKIAAAEQGPDADCAKVEALSERTYVRLTTEPDTTQDFPHEDVIGFLAGFARRRSDPRFADQQHQWLQEYLRSGDLA